MMSLSLASILCIFRLNLNGLKKFHLNWFWDYVISSKTCSHMLKFELGIGKKFLDIICCMLPLVGVCLWCDDSMSYCLEIFTV